MYVLHARIMTPIEIGNGQQPRCEVMSLYAKLNKTVNSQQKQRFTNCGFNIQQCSVLNKKQ
jgi:hypothetical protein